MNKPGVYIVNQNSSQIWQLKSDQQNTIGRGLGEKEESAILLPHPTVSKTHACIYLDLQTQHWYLENKSKNGSQVNGQAISQKFPLKHGDQIAIGPHMLIFYESFLADEGTVEISPLGGPQDFAGPAPAHSDAEIVRIIILLGAIVLFFVLLMKKF